MKRTSALAQFRQLCCLGLDPRAVMPSLLVAARAVIPAEISGFFWVAPDGEIAGFLPEYMIPEVVRTLMADFQALVARSLVLEFGATMRRGKAVEKPLPILDCVFSCGDVYHFICGPYRMHHPIDGVVHAAAGEGGLGVLVLGRSVSQPPFSAAERAMLAQVLHYLAQALQRPLSDAAALAFSDSGEEGLVILGQGRVLHASPRAREILQIAAPGSAPGVGMATATRELDAIFASLVRLANLPDAPPPVVHQHGAAGRFVFRAHWLDGAGGNRAALVGVVVQHQEPMPLVMMRRMQASGLSGRQMEVCLLLGQNCSFETIASRLHIKHTTAKDYADRIYRKLDVHNRAEMLAKLR